MVVVYYPNGRPERGEIDTDEDGVVDRWEYFRTDGSLEKVGLSRARNGQPDAWEPAPWQDHRMGDPRPAGVPRR